MRYGLASARKLKKAFYLVLVFFLNFVLKMRAADDSSIFVIILNKLESPPLNPTLNCLLPAGEAPDSDPKTFRVAFGGLDVPSLNGHIVFAILSVSQGSALVCQGWPTSTSSAFE